jgi:tetratricopeptide (TPR) repeat protein
LFAKVLKTRGRVLGEEHPSTLLSMRGLALVYLNQGRYDKAEPLLTKGVGGSRRALGERHPDTLASMSWLAYVYLREQRYSNAESLLREAIGGYQKAKIDAWDGYHCQSLLGESLAGQKKYVEAEPLLLSGYEGMLRKETAIPAARRAELNQAGNWIVRLYEDWGQAEKAVEWREKLRATRSAIHALPGIGSGQK